MKICTRLVAVLVVLAVLQLALSSAHARGYGRQNSYALHPRAMSTAIYHRPIYRWGYPPPVYVPYGVQPVVPMVDQYQIQVYPTPAYYPGW